LDDQQAGDAAWLASLAARGDAGKDDVYLCTREAVGIPRRKAQIMRAKHILQMQTGCPFWAADLRDIAPKFQITPSARSHLKFCLCSQTSDRSTFSGGMFSA
jgi:hypothetical protein